MDGRFLLDGQLPLKEGHSLHIQMQMNAQQQRSGSYLQNDMNLRWVEALALELALSPVVVDSRLLAAPSAVDSRLLEAPVAVDSNFLEGPTGVDSRLLESPVAVYSSLLEGPAGVQRIHKSQLRSKKLSIRRKIR